LVCIIRDWSQKLVDLLKIKSPLNFRGLNTFLSRFTNQSKLLLGGGGRNKLI